MKGPADLFARRALDEVAKILTLQDRNPHSPTYGCFDRSFWHYRTQDFPSGMAQEFAWPLALAFDTECPGNSYHGEEAIRDWALAGVRYAARASRSDGSCDDYYPFERATGAAAFSLLACLETCDLLGEDDPEVHAFLRTRGDWLTSHRETGHLSNHEALVVLNLVRLGDLQGSDRWKAPAEERLERLLSWQSGEGWFAEYDGCDPGYLTLTISLLARLQELRPSDVLRESVQRAVAFVSEFVHPDGSFGGEYGSRNTYNFFPHGFELAGRWLPSALAINDRVLAGLAAGLGACYADDHIVGHHAWNSLLAWRDFVAERPPLEPRGQGRRCFPEAGLLVERRGDAELYVGLRKGGAFKLFRARRLAASDTNFSVLQREGARLRNAVAHEPAEVTHRLEGESIEIEGQLGWAKQSQMSPSKMVALRLVMLTLGRFAPNLVRGLLQRLLISGRARAPFRFRRSLRWVGDVLEVSDALEADAWSRVAEVALGSHQTSTYNVMSRTWQTGQLVRGCELSDRVEGLTPGEPLKVERTL